MKKIISFTLTLLMLLSLCACSTGNQNVSSSTESKQTSVVPSSPNVSSSTSSPQGPARQMLAVDPYRVWADHGCGTETLKYFASGYESGDNFEFNLVKEVESGNYIGLYPMEIAYGLDPQTATRPNKDNFTIETAGESREYNFYYVGSYNYRGFGTTHCYQLSENAIDIDSYLLEQCGEEAYLVYFYDHLTSAVEVWDRSGSMRSICLLLEEFPEAKITGDITVDAVLNKAEEVVRMYDENFSLAEIMTVPTKTYTIFQGEYGYYVDGIVEPGENETFAGYRITCYFGEDRISDHGYTLSAEPYTCYFTVEYNAVTGWIYVYADKDVAQSGINIYSIFGERVYDSEEFSKIHDQLTEEVIAESVNAFLEKNLTDPAYAERWHNPCLYTLAHKNGCTIVELYVWYSDPEDDMCLSGTSFILTYEIPDGTALLTDVS